MRARAGDLANALDQVAGEPFQKSKITILHHVLLEPHEGGITIMAHNLDITACSSCPATGDMLPAVAVPAAAVRGLVRTFAADTELELTIEHGRLVIAYGASIWKLPALPSKDFPARLAAAAGAATVTFTAGEFKRHFGLPLHAADTDGTRFYLHGIFLERRDGALISVGCDGNRLTRVVSTPSDGASWSGIIIPLPAVELMLKRVRKDSAVELRFDGKIAEAHIGDTTIVTKLVDGTFPAYERILPETSANFVEIDRLALLAALERLAALADKDAVVAAGLTWSSVDNALTIMSTSDDAVVDFLEVTAIGGAARVGVAVHFLHDALDALSSGSNMRIEANGAAGPIKITTISDENILAVIMPRAWIPRSPLAPVAEVQTSSAPS
jgi:DNA polymerase-3 subunit beta